MSLRGTVYCEILNIYHWHWKMFYFEWITLIFDLLFFYFKMKHIRLKEIVSLTNISTYYNFLKYTLIDDCVTCISDNENHSRV